MHKKKYRPYRKSQITTVGEAIDDMLQTFKLSEKLNEKRLIESWEDVLGSVIKNRTKRIFIKNKVLFVELTSAPLKKELNMSKSKVIDLLTNAVGQGIIEDMIIM